MKRILFYEYSGFITEDFGVSTKISELPLNEIEINLLKNFFRSQPQGSAWLTIDENEIKAKNFVGIIAFESFQIEILPKVLRYSETSSSILQNLMFMLSYTHQLDVNETGIALLGNRQSSFIEAYISIFSMRLFRHLSKNGIPKMYLDRNENLYSVRGKINFTQHLAYNSLNRSRVFCEFSEFSEDNVLSRAFKFVASNLQKMTTQPESTAYLNKCIGLLDGVSTDPVAPQDLEKTPLGGKDINFKSLVNLTILFLKHLSPTFRGHSNKKVFSLLFDMNSLFEEFTFQVLNRNKSYFNADVKAQKKKRLVTAERNLPASTWTSNSLFDTYSDIVVNPYSGGTVIIDTKYKIIGEGSHYGIDNSDVYQALAYQQIHQSEFSRPATVLLFPESHKPLRKEFRITESKATVIAWTLNLSIDLRKELHLLIQELKELINQANSHSV